MIHKTNRITARRRWAALMGVLGMLVLTPPVGARIAAQPQREPAPARQDAAKAADSKKIVSARGCLRDVSELGGQGTGGQAWQGSIAGHVLTDVQIGPSQTTDAGSAGSAPSTAPASSSSQAAADPSAPRMLLITGLAESELRRYRGQQVEVQGTLGATRDVNRAAPARSGGTERSGSPPSGQTAGQPDSPKVGTGGSLRVPPSPTPGVTQAPTEFQATAIRGIARSCPTAAK